MMKLAALQKEKEASIIVCTEHNLDTIPFSVQSTLFNACKNLEPPTLVCLSSPISATNFYKPGRILMLSVGKVADRLMKSDQDQLGWWTYQKFQGRKGIQLTVINCYQVPKQNKRKGKFTIYAQQAAYLRCQNEPVQDIQKNNLT